MVDPETIEGIFRNLDTISINYLYSGSFMPYHSIYLTIKL